MTKPKFRRSDGHKYSRLGVRRKKLQKYRKPKGGDNKIRLNRAGRLRKVKVGFRSAVKERDLVKGKRVVMIYNINDLKMIREGVIGIVGKIGDKKRKEIAEYAKEKKIELLNLDAEGFLRRIEEKLKKTKEEKKARGEKKRARDKKAKEKEKKDKKKEEKKLEEKAGEKKDNTKKGEEQDNEGSDDLRDKNKEKEEADKNLETNSKNQRFLASETSNKKTKEVSDIKENAEERKWV